MKMFPLFLTILVVVVGGIAAGLQAPFTGIMSQKVGEMGSVLFTYGLGALVIVLISLGAAVLGQIDLSLTDEIPRYAFLAGPLGLVIIASLAFGVPRVGAVNATMLFLLGWLVFSAIIDHFGWFGTSVRPLDAARWGGIALLLAGSWLLLR